MKRTVPRSNPTMESVNVVHAAAIHEPKKTPRKPRPEPTRKLRRVGLSGALAGGFGGAAGFGGGGAAATAVALAPGGLAPSDCVGSDMTAYLHQELCGQT